MKKYLVAETAHSGTERLLDNFKGVMSYRKKDERGEARWCIQLTSFRTIDPKLQDQRVYVESWVQMKKEYLGMVVVSKWDGCPVVIVRAWVDGRPVENRDDFSRKRNGNIMAFGKDIQSLR